MCSRSNEKGATIGLDNEPPLSLNLMKAEG